MITESATSLSMLGEFFQSSPNFQTLNIPELISIGTNKYNNLVINNEVTSVILNNLEEMPYILGGKNLQHIELNNLKYIEFGESQIFVNQLSTLPRKFLQNTKLQEINLPNFLGAWEPVPRTTVGINESGANYASFWNNYWLKDVSMGENVSILNHNVSKDEFNGFWFRNNYNLKFIRLYHPYVLKLRRSLQGLNTTPIGNENGHIYVPNNLVDEYKNAWKSYVSQATLDSIIRPMDAYNEDKRQDVDRIPDSVRTWAEIITDCNSSNSLPDIYQVGATKTIIQNGIPTQMMIVELGNNITEYYLDNGIEKKPKIIWMSKSISNFDKVPLGILTNSARQYKSDT